MGYKEWKEAIPAIRELAFELRALDYCEVLHRGVVLGDDIELLDVEGPIRIRRVEKYVAKWKALRDNDRRAEFCSNDFYHRRSGH
ncbi:hypothetical protein LTR97_006532 [Elasticomyces elasticus]|uniref:Uncharacterized protein n=1 Tax=Elasticomyces elasticus TaxID=574655 RepID=A0AAN7W6G8_9PEZI|nr:hypothetical protein LTR97_006532 [Elasticomyces elasticus]